MLLSIKANRDPSAPLVAPYHDFPVPQRAPELAEFFGKLSRVRDSMQARRYGAWALETNDEAERVAHNLRSTMLRSVIKDPLVVPPNFPPPSEGMSYAPAAALSRFLPAPLRNRVFQEVMASESAVLEERAAIWRAHIRDALKSKRDAFEALKNEPLRSKSKRAGRTAADAPAEAPPMKFTSEAAKEHAQQAKFIPANETATGIVVVGQVRDGDSSDTGSQIAVSDGPGSAAGALAQLVGALFRRSAAGKTALAVRDKITKSDNEVVAKTFEAMGEVRDTVQMLKTKLLPETETALAIGAVRARMPNFEPESFSNYLETDFMPVLFRVIEQREFDMLKRLCTDGVVTQITSLHRARQAAAQTQRLEILDIKRIDLHEGILDGQEPQLRFMVGVTQLLFVLDKEGKVVEGSEADPMLAYYDVLMVINPDGPTPALRRGFRCARLQLISQQPTW
jgi:hypothetical protein